MVVVVDLNLDPLQIMHLLQLDLVEVEVGMELAEVQVDHKDMMVLMVVMTLVAVEEE